MVMGTHLVAREVTLHKGTRRSREVTLHSKVTHLHLELTHLHLRRTLLHLGHTLMHLEQWEAAMGRRDSSPTSCKALLVLVVMAVMGTNPVATGTRRSRGTLGATLHNKGTLLSMGTPRSSMDTLHSSMDTPLPVTLAHLVRTRSLIISYMVSIRILHSHHSTISVKNFMKYSTTICFHRHHSTISVGTALNRTICSIYVSTIVMHVVYV